MAQIIVPTATGFIVSSVSCITKKQCELEGVDPTKKVEEFREKQSKMYCEARNKIVNRSLFNRLRARLGFEPGGGGGYHLKRYYGHPANLDGMAKEYFDQLTRPSDYYLLEPTREIIPIEELVLVKNKEIRKMDVEIDKNGLGNYGYGRVLIEAIEVADKEKFPFVALEENGFEIAPKFSPMSREIPWTSFLLSLYARKR